MFLTNEQWSVLAPVLQKRNLDGRGRPRRDDREVLEGILWVLKTGAQWKHLPKTYPPYQTCHRRFQWWVQCGLIDHILEALAMDMEERGKIKLRSCFLDGTFAGAKKGDLVLDLRSAGKAPKSWRFRTKALFQSPSVWALLLQAKSGWLRQRLPPDLPERYRLASRLTERMIPIRLMRSLSESE